MRRRSLERWSPKKLGSSTWINFCMQFTSLQFDIMVNWQLSKPSVCWLVTLDRITGASVELTEVEFFLTADQVFLWIVGSNMFTNYKNKLKNRSSAFRLVKISPASFVSISGTTLMRRRRQFKVISCCPLVDLFFIERKICITQIHSRTNELGPR